MASTHPRIDIPQAQIEAFCHKWGVVEFALFGSVVRDDFRPDSDIDVMVKFVDGHTTDLFDIVDMKDELRQILGRQVDLVQHGTIENPFRRKSIMRDLTIVYAA